MSAKTSSQVTAESKAELPEPHYHTSERNWGHPQILPQPVHQITFFSNIFCSRHEILLQTLTLLPILSHSPRILTCLLTRCSQNRDLLGMASLLFRGEPSYWCSPVISCATRVSNSLSAANVMLSRLQRVSIWSPCSLGGQQALLWGREQTQQFSEGPETTDATCSSSMQL